MVTGAQIKQMLGDNHCKVNIPIFAKNAPEGWNTEIDAYYITLPGYTSNYQVDDYVWVAFDNNMANAPMILGHVQKPNRTNDTASKIQCKDIEISEQAKIPASSTIYGNSGISMTAANLVDKANSVSGILEKLTSLDSLVTNLGNASGVKEETTNLYQYKITTEDYEHPDSGKPIAGPTFYVTLTTKFDSSNKLNNIIKQFINYCIASKICTETTQLIKATKTTAAVNEIRAFTNGYITVDQIDCESWVEATKVDPTSTEAATTTFKTYTVENQLAVLNKNTDYYFPTSKESFYSGKTKDKMNLIVVPVSTINTIITLTDKTYATTMQKPTAFNYQTFNITAITQI